jgi:NAD(P)-dependent dehydrogenase (short-subunit alcohol dehydrogenase family)
MTQVLVVTGGSRGIGAAVALEAGRRGYAVAVNYQRNRTRAEAVVAAITGAGGTAIAVEADIGDEEAVTRLFAAADRLGPLAALVNSAGILGPVGRIEACDAPGLRGLFDTNLVGSFLCCREAIRRLSTKHGGKGGAIVNLSSAASRLGGAGETVPYAATKAAIDAFTFGLAQELAGEGIRVNAVSPGVIETEIHPAGRLERVGPLLPMKRPGTPEEVANAVLWLLSDEASYVSGTVLGVSGAR